MNGSLLYWYTREHVSYSPQDGAFFSLRTGKEKYHSIKNGYAIIQIGKKKFLAHRLAWLLTYGEMPSGAMDHKNRNKLDNRLSNLRLASAAENAQNRLVPGRYISKCIWFDNTQKKRKKRFCVRVQVRNKRHHIGWFSTEAEAGEAALTALQKFHAEFSGLTLKK